MDRKARIKILRGKKSEVGSYRLQYGQPFYDTETGQLYVGVKGEEQIQNTATVFQDGNGNIKIGSDFKDTSTNPETITQNAKIEISNDINNINNIIKIGDNKNPVVNYSINIGSGIDSKGIHIGNNLTVNSRNKTTDISIGNNITLPLIEQDLNNPSTPYDPNSIVQLGDNTTNNVNYSLYIGNQKLFYYDGNALGANEEGYILGDNSLNINTHDLNVNNELKIGDSNPITINKNGNSLDINNTLRVKSSNPSITTATTITNGNITTGILYVSTIQENSGVTITNLKKLNGSEIDTQSNELILGGEGKSSGTDLEQGKPVNTLNVRMINLIV